MNRKEERLNELSQLGHFLKGSSATLGLTKVKDACEKIQHYGVLKDETGSASQSKEKSLGDIKTTLKDVKTDYAEVAEILRRFFGEDSDESDEEDKSKDEKKSS
jgi:osomolarity two-component system phosphorelay intermediate protein YPD1